MDSMGLDVPRRATSGDDIFVEHDGSRFYMSRNDREQEYGAVRVPPEVEAEWIEALTSQRLDELNEPGNWRSVSFLANQADTRHLSATLAVAPRGKLWERCAYLELLLNYVDKCRSDRPVEEIQSAYGYVRQEAAHLLVRCRSEQSRGRVQRIVDAGRR
jgi:hypothetical protein